MNPPTPPGSPERAARQPIRTCIGCRRRRPQPELLRITRSEDGILVVGRTLPGRGAWLCRDDTTCLGEAVRRGGFHRAFRQRLPDHTIEALLQVLSRRDEPNQSHFVPETRPARD